jgi:hypothetical protein
LNKEGECTVEDLLVEEDTISECKQQNPKLLAFLSDKDNLKQLIYYATRDPEDPGNHNHSFK